MVRDVGRMSDRVTLMQVILMITVIRIHIIPEDETEGQESFSESLFSGVATETVELKQIAKMNHQDKIRN